MPSSGILPAVHNNWSSIGWIDSLDLLEEFQHADRWKWHPEVWPAGEVELGDQPGSSGTITALLWSTDTQSLDLCMWTLRTQITVYLFSFMKPVNWKWTIIFILLFFLPFCYLRQNITIKRAPVFLFPLSHISWMLSQEDAISFSQTLTCSVFRELNVKAVSLYCSATAQSSDGEGTKWILQSEGFHGWDGTHSSQKHRKRNSDSVRVWTS